jgi:hypothetical protein
MGGMNLTTGWFLPEKMARQLFPPTDARDRAHDFVTFASHTHMYECVSRSGRRGEIPVGEDQSEGFLG